MCYMIITGGSTVWFLLSLVADMLVLTAIMTPRWLVGSTAYIPTYNTDYINSLLSNIEDEQHRHLLQRKLLHIEKVPPVQYHADTAHLSDDDPSQEPISQSVRITRSSQNNYELSTLFSLTDYRRYPSVGIHSRCKPMQGGGGGFHCGRFDLDGFATDAHIYPGAWKAAMFFICLGCVLLSLSVLGTLMSCCRQALFGKSLHNVIACCQVGAGLSVLMALFLHPLGWSAERVRSLCGQDVEPFYAANCSLGISFYCAAMGAVLCFICAGISVKAESSNLRPRVKRRIEEGERLVCIP